MFYLQHEKNKKKMKENEIFTKLKGNVPMGQKTHWNVFYLWSMVLFGDKKTNSEKFSEV